MTAFKSKEVLNSVLAYPLRQALEGAGCNDAEGLVDLAARKMAQLEDVHSPQSHEPLRPHWKLHIDNLKQYKQLHAVSVCLCCMVEAHQVRLPCSHSLCEACFRFASLPLPLSANMLRVYDGPLLCRNCPFCAKKVDVEKILRPPTAGLRTICLDGGGVAAMTSIELLVRLMESVTDGVGFEMPIQDFFDLWVGTSAGGISAVGLGRSKWPLAFAKTKFVKLAKEVFGSPDVRGWWGWIRGAVNLAIGGSIYPDRQVRDSFREAFGDGPLVSNHAEEERSLRDLRVAVTAVENDCGVLTNYNKAADGIKCYQWFQKPQQGHETVDVSIADA